jgi:steroid 5-alpha reductase family enzyme
MLLDHIVQIVEVIGVFVTGLFILSIIIKRNDIADVAWGLGIPLVSLFSFGVGPQNSFTTVLTVVATLWGVRLSLRIFLRNRKKSEDVRYQKWRMEWGRWFYVRSYLQVYLLQGMLMVVVGYGFVHASVFGGGATLSSWQVFGLAVWAIGYFFEVVGDWQLDHFLRRAENRGKIMQQGLWRYTRHPNYFGEVTMWWGIWLIVAPLPLGYLALVSPLMITVLILKVSGIPMLERLMAGDLEFQKYQQRTSVFFPLPPRKIVDRAA